MLDSRRREPLPGSTSLQVRQSSTRPVRDPHHQFGDRGERHVPSVRRLSVQTGSNWRRLWERTCIRAEEMDEAGRPHTVMLSQEELDALIEARAAKLVEQQKQKAQAE